MFNRERGKRSLQSEGTLDNLCYYQRRMEGRSPRFTYLSNTVANRRRYIRTAPGKVTGMARTGFVRKSTKRAASKASTAKGDWMNKFIEQIRQDPARYNCSKRSNIGKKKHGIRRQEVMESSSRETDRKQKQKASDSLHVKVQRSWRRRQRSEIVVSANNSGMRIQSKITARKDDTKDNGGTSSNTAWKDNGGTSSNTAWKDNGGTSSNTAMKDNGGTSRKDDGKTSNNNAGKDDGGTSSNSVSKARRGQKRNILFFGNECVAVKKKASKKQSDLQQTREQFSKLELGRPSQLSKRSRKQQLHGVAKRKNNTYEVLGRRSQINHPCYVAMLKNNKYGVLCRRSQMRQLCDVAEVKNKSCRVPGGDATPTVTGTSSSGQDQPNLDVILVENDDDMTESAVWNKWKIGHCLATANNAEEKADIDGKETQDKYKAGNQIVVNRKDKQDGECLPKLCLRHQRQAQLRESNGTLLRPRVSLKKVDKLQAGGKTGQQKQNTKKLMRANCVIKADKPAKRKVGTDREKSKAPIVVELDPEFRFGQLVWGKLRGYPWWPGRVIAPPNAECKEAGVNQKWVNWYGDSKISLVDEINLKHFKHFEDYYSAAIFHRLKTYNTAVCEALKVAADRAYLAGPNGRDAKSNDGKEIVNREERDCVELIRWAFNNFQPGGPDSIEPSNDDKLQAQNSFHLDDESDDEMEELRAKVCRMKSVRITTMAEVREDKKRLEDVCFLCGDEYVVTEHPLFEGRLCETCKVDFLQSYFLYDEDGYQSFCSICSEGNEVLLCNHPSCSKVVCSLCMDTLIGPGTFEQEQEMENWLCYICRPEIEHGLLRRREDWISKLHEMMTTDIDFSKSPTRITFPLPLNKDKRPIRVLSLFDGISPVAVILEQLGIEVDCFYASEPEKNATIISGAGHYHKNILYVPCVREITEEKLAEWGEFDLLVAGSRISNLKATKAKSKDCDPDRFAQYPSTERAVEFHRIFEILTRNRESSTPFFWLFESESGINEKEELSISRLLKTESMIFDSMYVSAVKGLRYFWGNLPGMNRPGFWKKNYEYTVQDFLLSSSCPRQAQVQYTVYFMNKTPVCVR
ncbi:uncharacterized protein [Ptychodera flava]|uniref:uncharacterized protein n=1 Tax=Ptychodera flava TaxID=63121 RepID=UPI00396AA32F